MTDTVAPLSEKEQHAELLRQVKLLYKHLADQYRQGKDLDQLLLQIFRNHLVRHGMAGTWPLTPSNFKRDDYAYETNHGAHVVFANAAISYLRHKEYSLAVGKAAGASTEAIEKVIKERGHFSTEEYKRAIAEDPTLASSDVNRGFTCDQVLELFLKEVGVEYEKQRKERLRRGSEGLPPYPLKNYRVKDGTLGPDEPPLPGEQDRGMPKPPKPLEGGAMAELVEEVASAPAVAGVDVRERVGTVTEQRGKAK